MSSPDVWEGLRSAGSPDGRAHSTVSRATRRGAQDASQLKLSPQAGISEPLVGTKGKTGRGRLLHEKGVTPPRPSTHAIAMTGIRPRCVDTMRLSSENASKSKAGKAAPSSIAWGKAEQLGREIALFQQQTTDDALEVGIRAREYEDTAAAAVSLLQMERTARIRSEAEREVMQDRLAQAEARLGAACAETSKMSHAVEEVKVLTNSLATADEQLSNALKLAAHAATCHEKAVRAEADVTRLAVQAEIIPHLQQAIHGLRASRREVEVQAAADAARAARDARDKIARLSLEASLLASCCREGDAEKAQTQEAFVVALTSHSRDCEALEATLLSHLVASDVSASSDIKQLSDKFVSQLQSCYATLEKIEAENAAIRVELRSAREAMERAESEREEAQAVVVSATSEIEAASTACAAAAEDAAGWKTRCEAVESELSISRQRITKLEAELAASRDESERAAGRVVHLEKQFQDINQYHHGTTECVQRKAGELAQSIQSGCSDHGPSPHGVSKDSPSIAKALLAVVQEACEWQASFAASFACQRHCDTAPGYERLLESSAHVASLADDIQADIAEQLGGALGALRDSVLMGSVSQVTLRDPVLTGNVASGFEGIVASVLDAFCAQGQLIEQRVQHALECAADDGALARLQAAHSVTSAGVEARELYASLEVLATELCVAEGNARAHIIEERRAKWDVDLLASELMNDDKESRSVERKVEHNRGSHDRDHGIHTLADPRDINLRAELEATAQREACLRSALFMCMREKERCSEALEKAQHHVERATAAAGVRSELELCIDLLSREMANSEAELLVLLRQAEQAAIESDMTIASLTVSSKKLRERGEQLERARGSEAARAVAMEREISSLRQSMSDLIQARDADLAKIQQYETVQAEHAALERVIIEVLSAELATLEERVPGISNEGGRFCGEDDDWHRTIILQDQLAALERQLHVHSHIIEGGGSSIAGRLESLGTPATQVGSSTTTPILMSGRNWS